VSLWREERRVCVGEGGQGASPEPANHVLGREVQRLGRRTNQPSEMRVGIASKRGIGARQAGGAEQVVPRVLTVVAGDRLFEQVEDDAFHGELGNVRGRTRVNQSLNPSTPPWFLVAIPRTRPFRRALSAAVRS
jgi:hypothetical protein